MATPQALKAAKKELRALMKAKLSQIPKTSLESQSKSAFQALLGLRQYQDAKKISIYLSMPTGEVQTDEFVRHALNSGKDVFVPYLHQNLQAEVRSGEACNRAPKQVMDMVRLRGVKDYEGLERDPWGIPTVTERGLEGRERVLGGSTVGSEEGSVSLDLMLLPGVAFEVEEAGLGMVRRLGHGKGFYDYFLHRYRSIDEGSRNGEGAGVALFGLALKEQVLRNGEQEPHIPVGPHDSPLNGLILGDGKIIEAAPT